MGKSVVKPDMPDEARRRGLSEDDVGGALPEYTVLVEGMTRMLRDVEAMRFALRSLMPEAEREVGAKLIQQRFRIPAQRARLLLGLPPALESSP